MTYFDALSIVPISSGFIVIDYHGNFSNNDFTSFSYLYLFVANKFISNESKFASPAPGTIIF